MTYYRRVSMPVDKKEFARNAITVYSELLLAKLTKIANMMQDVSETISDPELGEFAPDDFILLSKELSQDAELYRSYASKYIRQP